MKKTVIYFLILFVCNSCATLINKPTTNIKLYSDKQTELIVNKKKYIIENKNKIKVLRQNDTLILLLRLAEKAQLSLTDEIKIQLVTITAFNINTRYDDYKMSFKKQCTTEFTEEWIEKLKELRSWIKTLIQQ